MTGLLRDAGTALLVRAGGAVCAYAMVLLLARWLRPEDYGALGAVLSCVALMTVAVARGEPLGLLRVLAEDRKLSGGLGARAAVLRAGGRVLGPAGAVALGGLALAAALVAGGAAEQPGPGRTLAIVLAGLVLLPPFAATELAGTVLRTQGRIVLALAPREVLWRLGLVALGLAVTRLLPGERQLPALLASGALLLCGLAAAQAARAWRALPARGQPAPAEGASRHALWITDLSAVGLNNLDVLVVALVLSAEQAAPYFAASRTAGLAGFALNAVNPVIAPRLSAAVAEGDRARLGRTLALGAALAFLPAVGALGLVLALGGELLSLFGPGFGVAQGVLVVLALGQLVNAGTGSCGLLLTLAGSEVANARLSLYALGFALLLMPVAALLAGVAGVATVGTAALCGRTLMQWMLARRALGLETSVLGVMPVLRARAGRC